MIEETYNHKRIHSDHYCNRPHYNLPEKKKEIKLITSKVNWRMNLILNIKILSKFQISVIKHSKTFAIHRISAKC